MRTLPSAEARASAPTGRASPVPLGLILALGLGLRLWGLGWGLPNEHHYYSYHPDEAYLLQTSSPAFGGLDLPHGKFLPHFYS
ncbi:MAG TPA: hypothetical protein VKL61_08290, partial [Candidatus Polarisedimenticolia bacterium]|nr:hypothetical protein [Candidatus Polarisedimenticolia bacterium]